MPTNNTPSEKNDYLYISRWTDFSEVTELKHAVQILPHFHHCKSSSLMPMPTFPSNMWHNCMRARSHLPYKPVLTVHWWRLFFLFFLLTKQIFLYKADHQNKWRINVFNLEMDLIRSCNIHPISFHILLRPRSNKSFLYFKRGNSVFSSFLHRSSRHFHSDCSLWLFHTLIISPVAFVFLFLCFVITAVFHVETLQFSTVCLLPLLPFCNQEVAEKQSIPFNDISCRQKRVYALGLVISPRLEHFCYWCYRCRSTVHTAGESHQPV